MRQLHTLLVPVAAAITLATAPYQVANAQQPSLKRTAVLDTDMAGMEGKQAHMWVGDLAPGAETGKHTHPTPRFVYVMEGSVTLEVEGQPPRIFKVGDGFQEMPGIVHNFKNASSVAPAKALGFQIAEKGQPLQNSP